MASESFHPRNGGKGNENCSLAKYAKYRQGRQENHDCFLAFLAVLGVLGEKGLWHLSSGKRTHWSSAASRRSPRRPPRKPVPLPRALAEAGPASRPSPHGRRSASSVYGRRSRPCPSPMGPATANRPVETRDPPGLWPSTPARRTPAPIRAPPCHSTSPAPAGPW